MKRIVHVFTPFIKEVADDFMLAACVFGPLIIGAVFRFLLPGLESVLCGRLGAESILSPHYALFDMLLAVMTPVMFCFAGVLVVLDETDSGVVRYYAVTPLGKSGYLLSRIGIPAAISIVYDVVLLSLFTVSGLDILMACALSLSGTLTAIVTTLIIATFAKNKMEGMALVKFSGLLILGIPAACFVTSPVRYLFGVLPSFWMAELCLTDNCIYLIPMLLTSAALILALYGRYRRKAQ